MLLERFETSQLVIMSYFLAIGKLEGKGVWGLNNIEYFLSWEVTGFMAKGLS